MRKSFALLLIACISLDIGCSRESKEKQEDDPNKNLYNQVMDIHDEVMPNMDELYTLKRQLQKKIENSPDLVENKRQQLETTILLIDSASRGMMKWMNDFSPEDYSSYELHDYLESEMKRVKQVKEAMLDALEKGRKANQE